VKEVIIAIHGERERERATGDKGRILIRISMYRQTLSDVEVDSHVAKLARDVSRSTIAARRMTFLEAARRSSGDPALPGNPI